MSEFGGEAENICSHAVSRILTQPDIGAIGLDRIVYATFILTNMKVLWAGAV
jgi:hypothetical protein